MAIDLYYLNIIFILSQNIYKAVIDITFSVANSQVGQLYC